VGPAGPGDDAAKFRERPKSVARRSWRDGRRPKPEAAEVPGYGVASAPETLSRRFELYPNRQPHAVPLCERFKSSTHNNSNVVGVHHVSRTQHNMVKPAHSLSSPTAFKVIFDTKRMARIAKMLIHEIPCLWNHTLTGSSPIPRSGGVVRGWDVWATRSARLRPASDMRPIGSGALALRASPQQDSIDDFSSLQQTNVA
jgi:hypothetical protein